ncbi:MAG TPA: histidine kinase [Thermomicrobiales bacterium]|nr:histidine kinase [Thermomicrobiales bacterium]
MALLAGLAGVWARRRPRARRAPAVGAPYSDLVLTGSVVGIPAALSIVGAVLAFAFSVALTFGGRERPLQAALGVEGLYLACLLLFLVQTAFPTPRVLVACYAAAFALAAAFDLVGRSRAGDLVMAIIACLAFYRLPLRWSLTVVVLLAAALAWERHPLALLHAPGIVARAEAWGQLGLAAFVFAIAYGFRVRHLLILQLDDAQARLRAEMARTAELAAARERARIARDIHDVLAHSLTALSVQVQATRQIARTQPERVPAALDDIAAQVRESLAESRRAVSVLREAAAPAADGANLAARLRATLARFGERVGLSGALEERGTTRALAAEQAEALEYALREALTNAHRHGAARQVRATLIWGERAVTLEVCDDGDPAAAPPSPGTGNGLRGMRERAAALGGDLAAGPRPGGGYRVALTLPYDAGAGEEAARR